MYENITMKHLEKLLKRERRMRDNDGVVQMSQCTPSVQLLYGNKNVKIVC
jgi:hypothetical protein